MARTEAMRHYGNARLSLWKGARQLAFPEKKGDSMGLLAAYAVPHPPLIVPVVGAGQEAAIADTTAACEEVARRIAAHNPDVVVITSPHAPLYRDGFFIADTPTETGSLSAFGHPEARITTHTDLRLGRAIADRLRRRDIPTAGAPATRGEIDHATFVPLHFLARALDLEDVDVVRIGLSGLSDADHEFLGLSITRAAEDLGRRAVLVASGDWSHKLTEDGPYGFASEGPLFDRALADIFARGDLRELFSLDATLCENAAECGLRSFEIMAGALEGLPFTSELLSYEGPFGVGYGVAAFEVGCGPSSTEEEVEVELRGAHARKRMEQQEEWAAEGGGEPAAEAETEATAKAGADGEPLCDSAGEPAMETDPDSNCNANPESYNPFADPAVDPLVALARASVESIVGTGQVLPLPQGLPDELTGRRAGAFVSLHEHGQLRGCIGTIAPVRSCIAEEVIMNAVAAATEDPRFQPVRPDELDYLDYSVDVLGAPEPVDCLEELDPKRYGVIVTRGLKRGLLLPDLEGVGSVLDQIAIAKQKAGIRPDQEVKLERFEVARHTAGGEPRHN